jgi:hypothetical protein
MQRGTLAWYRLRMFTGILFAVAGIIIGIELIGRPGAPTAKLPGFAFVAVALALSIVRIQQYLKARSALR